MDLINSCDSENMLLETEDNSYFSDTALKESGKKVYWTDLELLSTQDTMSGEKGRACLRMRAVLDDFWFI